MSTHGRWRVSLISRAFFSACAGVILVVGVLLTAGGDRVSDRVGGLLLVVVTPLAYWLFGVRPRVQLDAEWLTVQNPFRRTRVHLSEVSGVSSGYSGLEVALRDGSTVSAWAVQRANLSALLGRRTRADRVADAIRTARDQQA